MARIPKIAPIQGPWPLPYTKKHCLDFSFVFSTPLSAYQPCKLLSIAWIFLCIFSSLTCLPALLSTAWIFPLHLQLPYLPTGLKHRSQITEGLVLRPFSYTRGLLTHCTVSTSQFLCVGDGSQRALCFLCSYSLSSSPSLEDSSFVKTWVLPSCTFLSPLLLCWVLCFIGLAYQEKFIVFRFIIEYSSLMDFGP
jgi:hypothetical protein